MRKAPLEDIGTRTTLTLACPLCRGPLEVSETRARCAGCAAVWPGISGIWRFLPEERAHIFATFLAAYRSVRREEGWGSPEPDYFRSLPHVSPTDPQHAIWRIRARNYRALLERVVQPLEEELGRPLRILDLGAGNGWLSYRLAQRGHAVAAIDLSDDELDGLGAHVWYDAPFLPVQAEFDRLPFADGQADLVVFNGSLHYAADIAVSLRETLHVLAPGGRIVVMDSPVYRHAAAGKQMARTGRMRGGDHHIEEGEGFLTYDRLEEAGAALGVPWTAISPFHGLRWALQPARDRLAGKREPARFPLFVGVKPDRLPG